MMRRRYQILLLAAAAFLAARAGLGATNHFERQLITLPFNANAVKFMPLDEHGPAALLAIDPTAKKLLIYRQRPSGFTNAVDQELELPPKTAWVAACDVDSHPGLELVMSTPTGLVYYRQNNGRFDPAPRVLFKGDQVFTNDDTPSLLSLTTNTELPLVSAQQTIVYMRNSSYEWRPGQPLPLQPGQTSWSDYQSQWTLGQSHSRGMRVQETMRVRPDQPAAGPTNDTVRKLVEELKNAGSQSLLGTNIVDINHDGRPDFLLWHVIPGLEPRTDVYVFLKQADGRLPDRPNQVLHGRGLPIPLDSTEEQSVVGDLKRDGNQELVLLELKSPLTSTSGLLEMALSMGVDCALAIRTFHDGAFSGTPDARVRFTLILALEALGHWPVFVGGDFNGDGVPDFLVQRFATEWKLHLSTRGPDWFTPQPAMAFETPINGYLTVQDLNGDGRSDIILRQWDNPRVYVFLTQPQPAEGRHP